MGDQQVLDFKMASRKGCLSINEVIAALGEENDSEIDSDSSSELDESTDDSADEVQVPSMANVDPCFQDSLFHSDDDVHQVSKLCIFEILSSVER